MCYEKILGRARTYPTNLELLISSFETWQRMVSRLELYGPISMECPASIMRLGKGTCYVSEVMARPFASWRCGAPDWEI